MPAISEAVTEGVVVAVVAAVVVIKADQETTSVEGKWVMRRDVIAISC